MILKFSSLWSVCRNVYINMFFFLTEIEAKEACDWLKAAGFPQYAQLYEGNTHTHMHVRFTVTSSHVTVISAPVWLPILFFPSCLFFYFSTMLPSSYPLSLARCVLFPGFSSCPERWVMGKALLSLLGFAQLFSLFILPPLFFYHVLSLPTGFLTVYPSFQNGESP